VDFRGHLRLPEDAGTGIPVRLRLDDIFVVISSGGDELGAWRADDVAIERIFSNQFSIVLDGESMVFIAQDALGFAYEGVTAIEDLQERLGKKRKFRRSKKKDKAVDAAAPADASPDLEPADSEDAIPAEEPVLSSEPLAIWSPPQPGTSVTPPAASTGSRPLPEYEPVVEESVPFWSKQEADPSEEVRVSYPQAPRPVPPTVPTFVPPVADETDRETSAPTPAAPEPAPAASAAPAVTEPAPPTDVSAAMPIEFEIEEVAPAATGAMWRDETSLDVSASELELEPKPAAALESEAEPEMEIDDYMLPAAGRVETFDHRHPEPAAATPEPELPVDEPVSEAPAPVEARVPETVETEPEEVEVPPTEEVVHSNGHGPIEKVEDVASKPERRHSLFGRSRDKKVPPHDHRYGEPKTIGGLTRQVCDVCGHVTFSGEDVYQGW
jgi:hypothetical protein